MKTNKTYTICRNEVDYQLAIYYYKLLGGTFDVDYIEYYDRENNCVFIDGKGRVNTSTEYALESAHKYKILDIYKIERRLSEAFVGCLKTKTDIQKVKIEVLEDNLIVCLTD